MAVQGNSAVNPHYLDNVMTVAEERQVEATEDIYSENGMKLVAKGYAINNSMRERLIEHKLTKPLEDCMAVSDGVTGARCAEVAQRMLDTYPVLQAMHGQQGSVKTIQLMQGGTYAGRLQTLLTVYNEHRPGKLDHAVCVSLLALNLAQRIQPSAVDELPAMLLAGLAHDVGELYIDPAFLQKDAQLGPKEWRHIAAHPVITHSLLKDLSGLARPASTLILTHHERLDGFGYPQGLRAEQLPVSAQILAAAEMLAGMLEDGSMLVHANIAVNLVYGEFSRAVIDAISQSSRECREADAQITAGHLEDTLRMSHALGERLKRLEQAQLDCKTQIERASAPFKALWQLALARFVSIRRAWSSTGLDVHPDGAWLLQEPPAIQHEVAIILKEINWRLGELEREMQSRVTRQAAGDLPVLELYLRQVKQPSGAGVAQ